MRWARWIAVMAALAPAACAVAQTTPSTQSSLTVDAVLDALDQRGKTLRDFSAKVEQTETDNVGYSVSHTGQAWLQNGDDAKLRVTFDKKIEGDVTRVQKKEILLADGWLWDRDYKTKTQNRYQVVKPGEKMDLLKLGQGPFPLPIGQDKAEVHEAFDVQLMAAAKDDPPDTMHLQLTPRDGTALAHKFAAVDVWMDAQSHMPVRIQTLNAAKDTTNTTAFNDVKINQGLAADQFTLPEVTGWNERDEPYGG